MIKIAIEPEMKSKYLKLTKHLLIATVLVTISLSLVNIPKHYYGETVTIVDYEESDTTISQINDNDCQGRETININGKWYVVTDTNCTIGTISEDTVMTRIYPTVSGNEHNLEKYKIENISVLKLFSECQGTFKGNFADIRYYRDKDGFIFPASWTYSNYQNSKRGIGRRWLWWW